MGVYLGFDGVVLVIGGECVGYVMVIGDEVDGVEVG